ETGDRRLSRLVTIDAKAHRVIHNPLRHRHGRQITVAGGAFDAGLYMRRVVKPNMRFFEKSVDPLPVQVLTLFRIVGKLCDPRIARDNLLVASHADINAWNTGHGSPIHTGMTV